LIACVVACFERLPRSTDECGCSPLSYDRLLLRPVVFRINGMITLIRRTTTPQCWYPIALATGLVCGIATIARAEVHVEGSQTALRVTTSQNTIADVLSALRAAVNVKYRSAIPLDAAANATYSGSVGQVISRLLDGYSYMIKKNEDATDIVIYGRRGGAAIAPKAPPAKGIVSRWR
jgi:hypothetical protein